MPRMVSSWLRNYIATLALYFGVGGAWSYYIYWCFGDKLFAAGEMPSWKSISDQMKASLLPKYPPFDLISLRVK